MTPPIYPEISVPEETQPWYKTWYLNTLAKLRKMI